MRFARFLRAGVLAAVAAVAVVAATSGCTPSGPGTTGQAAPAADEKRPSLQDEMRMPWSPLSGGYLREWLICGPFDSPRPAGLLREGSAVGAAFEQDLLKAAGGEAGIQPAAGQRVTAPDGNSAAWTRYVSEADEVDLAKALAGAKVQNVVAYAYATFPCDADGPGLLALGSDDSVRVWLNGRLVHDHRVGRAVVKDEDIVAVQFRRGVNRLLLKVENGAGGWGYVARPLAAGQASALEVAEIRPAIEPPPGDRPDLLCVRTDAAGGLPGGQMGAIRVEAIAPGGKVVGAAQVRRGEVAYLETAGWADGPYEVRLSRPAAKGYTVFRHLPWYKGDWRKQAEELMQALDRLPAEPKTATELRLRVLGMLVLDRCGGDPRKVGGQAAPKPAAVTPSKAAAPDWLAVHSPLMEHREVQLGQAAAIRPLGFLRLAWVDELDDSPQYARAYLPGDYDPKDAAKRWPLVVVLHGYNPSNPEYVRWWSVAERHSSLAERHNAIILEPHGRANTGYLGIGDADVLRAIDEAKKAFRVDDDRVYLTGYSMGGGGTWHVGTRHPELFAAIAPIYGGWDYHIRLKEQELAALTPSRKLQAEADSSFIQAEGLLTTPVFVNHGDADALVDVAYSRYAVRMLQRWGYEVRYWEHPGEGHGRLGCEDEMLRWMLARKLDRQPRQVRIRSADLRTASAHWIRITQRQDPFALMVADARVIDPCTIRLDTENALEVRLAPPPGLIDGAKPIRVLWNGRDAGAHAPRDGAVVLQAAGYRPGGRAKTPQAAGPTADVMNTPFAIVVGTAAKDPAMARFIRLRAEAARDAWKEWQKVSPRYFLDSEIAEEDIRRYSLILFGGPAENLIARRFAKDIPLAIAADLVTIDGKPFAARDAAVTVCCPHPLAAGRYLQVIAGTSPTGMFFTHRLPEHLDFAVAEPLELADSLFEELCVVGGRLDHNWRLDERYLERGAAGKRAAAVRLKAPSVMSAAVKEPRLYVADLLPQRTSGSFAFLMRDMNWRGKPIRLAGRSYGRGVGVQVWHEPCSATFDLAGGNWKRLRATVGIEIDDPAKLEPKQKDGTRVYFIVRGDGRELYRSPTFRWNSPPAEMDADIAGVKELELVAANESTWFNAASSVDWAELRLEK